jgi:hypothetical protein
MSNPDHQRFCATCRRYKLATNVKRKGRNWICGQCANIVKNGGRK